MKIKNLYIGNIFALEYAGFKVNQNVSILVLPRFIKRSLFYKKGNHAYDLLDKNKRYKVRNEDTSQDLKLINKKFVMHCQFVGNEISDAKRLSKRQVLSLYKERKKEK